MSKIQPTKNEEILMHLISIKEDVSAIKEHLKTLNGKVATNVQNIECNRLENKEIDKNVRKLEIKIAYYAGGLLVVWAIAQILIDNLFLI